MGHAPTPTPTPTHKHSFPPSFPSSLPQQAHTHTQMHGLGCTLLPPQHPTHPQGRREGKGEEYSTKPCSHAAQVHHTPLHAINNENKAGKRKKKKRTGVGNEENAFGYSHAFLVHLLFIFDSHSFFHPHTLFTFLPRFLSFSLFFPLFFSLSNAPAPTPPTRTQSTL